MTQKKPNFALILSCLAQFWVPKFWSYHCIQFQEKIMIQTQENGKKLHFGLNSARPLGHKFGCCQFFFSKIWLRRSLDYHVRLSFWTISEKTDDQILRAFRDRRMDITDRHTDRRLLIGSTKCQFTLKEQCFLNLSIFISWYTKNK